MAADFVTYDGLMALQKECVEKARKAMDNDQPAPAARWFEAAERAARGPTVTM